MDEKKDYYATLGVLPSAEDFVIEAACVALVNRYRCKGWTQDAALAHVRMAAINEAYDVLRNPEQRVVYDAAYRASAERNLDNDEADAVFEEALSEVQAQWQAATDIFPDLLPIRAGLRRRSYRLEFSFVVLLLEKGNFKDRVNIAAQLENELVATYLAPHRTHKNALRDRKTSVQSLAQAPADRLLARGHRQSDSAVATH